MGRTTAVGRVGEDVVDQQGSTPHHLGGPGLVVPPRHRLGVTPVDEEQVEGLFEVGCDDERGTDEPDDDVRGALVSLLHSIRDKVTELDPRVPADFVAWLVALDFAPFVIDTLALVRYGEAQMSTVLRAFGTPVDASMVPDPAKILNR